MLVGLALPRAARP